LPELSLQKKHNEICYHWVQEAVAIGMIWVVKEGINMNLTDLCTKILPMAVRSFLLQRIMHWYSWSGARFFECLAASCFSLLEPT
jgi:hypothetical protein